MEENKENLAEMEIAALADVFGVSTSGFEDFYKTAKDSQKGNYSKAASSGNGSTAASSGNYSKAASSGENSTAASSGNGSKAASSGENSTAASSGNYSTAASSGEYAACSALGYRAAVKGDMGNLLMASEYLKKENGFVPVGGRADIVDGKTLKPECWYIVENRMWVEVDFTDGVFSYVLSNKRGVKKVRTESGEELYIVSDDKGNSAHGKTIKEARKDLVFKVTANFDGVLPDSATGAEWVAIYRAVTGACSAGVRGFVEETGRSLDQTYTASEIGGLVKGRYGAERFVEAMKKNGGKTA